MFKNYQWTYCTLIFGRDTSLTMRSRDFRKFFQKYSEAGSWTPVSTVRTWCDSRYTTSDCICWKCNRFCDWDFKRIFNFHFLYCHLLHYHGSYKINLLFGKLIPFNSLSWWKKYECKTDISVILDHFNLQGGLSSILTSWIFFIFYYFIFINHGYDLNFWFSQYSFGLFGIVVFSCLMYYFS